MSCYVEPTVEGIRTELDLLKYPTNSMFTLEGSKIRVAITRDGEILIQADQFALTGEVPKNRISEIPEKLAAADVEVSLKDWDLMRANGGIGRVFL